MNQPIDTTPRRKVLLTIVPTLITVIGFAVPTPAGGEELRGLEQYLKAERRRTSYVPITSVDFERCETLFLRTFQSGMDSVLADAWQQFGFEIVVGEDSESILIRERTTHRRGWGMYLIRPRHHPGIVLQAPHSFADRFTGNLVIRLVRDGSFAGAAWNTAHRKQVDVAHDPSHPFTAFTRALVQSDRAATVIQIHGFAQEHRKTEAGMSADVILSNGTRAPATWVRKTALLMQSDFPFGRTKLYPTSVQELGATTNVQAEAMRLLGSDRFLHVELSHAVRVRLVADAAARRMFLKNLTAGAD